jgi:hypothetical protein
MPGYSRYLRAAANDVRKLRDGMRVNAIAPAG